MDTTVTIDLAPLANELGLPEQQLRRTVELLDEGNTVPFITRYRKDQTGGLDEEQIRQVQDTVTRQRMLAERKRTILKSIESQGKLTDELAEKIRTATSTKRLEDLYLPYKPKKQTLATIARDRGLEPLAREILKAEKNADDLDRRAQDFVDIDKGLRSQADVLLGVGHLIAEQFSERADLREVLRNIVRRTGKIVSTRIPSTETEAPAAAADTEEPASEAGLHIESVAADAEGPHGEADAAIEEEHPLSVEEAATEVESTDDSEEPAEETPSEADQIAAPVAENSSAEAAASVADATVEPAATAIADSAQPEGETDAAPETAAVPPQADPAERQRQARLERKKRKEEERKRKKKKQESAFKDYFKFEESIGKLPPHRILAINRGERARVLRVKLEADFDAMRREAEEKAVPADHKHGEFLRGCLKDALARLIIPALEREVRRELTDKAEEHAVAVFARNLRKLLLTPPVSGHRVLAIDPGFRSGCKLAALDEFGNLHGHGAIYLIGGGERLKRSRARLIEMITLHKITVVAIGNGTACRETEQLVADVLATELKDADISYVIVNEAGASVYSTSPVGREELGQYEASQRSAVSIGRRLLDPLSELVKINPANIGVGLYQHDMKSKHLQDSLDAVVQSCVNYVGVDLNTASPSLLSYVSGLNQLTARRLFEYRQQRGPFASREQLKDVPGIGEATFVQAAGFLKIAGGDDPLDATWIHPESYGAAQQILGKLGCGVDELAREVSITRGNAAARKKPADGFAKGLVAPAERPASEETPGTAEVPPAAESSAAPANEPPAPQVEDVPATPAATSEAATLVSEVATVNDAPSDETLPATSDAPAVSESGTPAPTSAEAALPETVIEPERTPSLIAQRAAAVESRQLAAELQIGELLCRDILTALTRPGRDPREDLPPPLFRREVLKLEDLKPGMELAGTVLNVVDFGAFVDIGLHDTGLVHISRLADRYIRDPHEVVGVGDTLRVWVQSVDKERRRVSLTAIRPGTQRQDRQRRDDRPRPAREQRDQKDQSRRPQQQRTQQQRPQQQRSPRPQQAGQAPQQGQQRPQRRQDDRPPRGRHDKRDNRRDARPAQGRPFELQSKKEVKKKLTKAMKEGRAPLRTFGDLKQFLELQQPPEEEKPTETQE
jgi:uncharacterized protein